MVAPMIARDNAIGAIAVWRSARSGPFTDAELSFFDQPRAPGDDRGRQRDGSTRTRWRRGGPRRRRTRRSRRSWPR